MSNRVLDIEITPVGQRHASGAWRYDVRCSSNDFVQAHFRGLPNNECWYLVEYTDPAATLRISCPAHAAPVIHDREAFLDCWADLGGPDGEPSEYEAIATLVGRDTGLSKSEAEAILDSRAPGWREATSD